MRKTLVVCDGCQKEHAAHTLAFSDWLQRGKDYHFCSVACFAKHFQVSMQHDPQEEKPACKARRFLLWDESANSTEGVLWGNGRVTIEPPYDTGTYTFPSWDRFKESNPGSGVQWIDQEVSE